MRMRLRIYFKEYKMTFTLLTLAIFMILGLVIFKGVLRGSGHGLIRTLMDLVAIVLSLMVGSLLSSLLYAKKLGERLIGELGLEEKLSELSESIGGNFDTLINALATMVVSSVIFVIVYFAVLIISKLVITILYKTVLKPDANDLGYPGEDEPWFKRNDSALGGVVGGLAAFLSVTVIFAPVIGTLKMVDKAIGVIQVVYPDAVNEDSEGLATLKEFSDDFGVTFLYTCGGNAVYDLGARTTIKVYNSDGKKTNHTVVLSKEIENIEDMSYDIKSLVENLKDFKSVGSDDFRRLGNLCNSISDSYFLSIFASDCVSGAAESWMMDEEFLGISFPIEDDTLAPLFDGVFHVFAATDETKVADDLATFIEVCALVVDSGILDAGGDYSELMSLLEDGVFIDRLTVVLSENPRMASLTDILYRTAMRSLVDTIKFDGYDVDEYKGLMENITGQLNRLQGQKTEKKVETLTDYAVEYMGDYGVEVPEAVAEMVVSAMIKEIPEDENGYIDPSKVEEFFDKYYTSGN